MRGNGLISPPNYCVERMRASRSGQLQFERQWRLAPTAHAQRSIYHEVIGKDIPTRLLNESDVLISQADGITAIVMEAR